MRRLSDLLVAFFCSPPPSWVSKTIPCVWRGIKWHSGFALNDIEWRSMIAQSTDCLHPPYQNCHSMSSKKFSVLILLRSLFLLRTSAKCASALCSRFVVGSAFHSKRKTKSFPFSAFRFPFYHYLCAEYEKG